VTATEELKLIMGEGRRVTVTEVEPGKFVLGFEPPFLTAETHEHATKVAVAACGEFGVRWEWKVEEV
jgi:hypothetical protein